jgi:hypothetical protein
MQLIVLVPRVLRDYVAQLPEVQRNAYNYFNYDHRVVEERVPRGDCRAPYKNADDFTNADYDSLVSYAKTIVNPVLAKYSARVANEDAMNIAIRSFDNGLFDGKVNANKFEVLVNAMAEQEMQPLPQPAQQEMQPVVMAAMKSKKKEKPSKPVTRTVLKQLGLEPHKVPLRSQIRRKIQKGIPHLVRNPGKGVMVEK